MIQPNSAPMSMGLGAVGSQPERGEWFAKTPCADLRHPPYVRHGGSLAQAESAHLAKRMEPSST